jgi:hypothetical protein
MKNHNGEDSWAEIEMGKGVWREGKRKSWRSSAHPKLAAIL